MKRFRILLYVSLLGVLIVLGTLALWPRRAQNQGLAGNPEEQAQQAALEANYPKMAVS